ncbi:unnamed protein product [Arabidopsis lyrata]|nr:unnamed protein product [Arabidopsis lyrata]
MFSSGFGFSRRDRRRSYSGSRCSSVKAFGVSAVLLDLPLVFGSVSPWIRFLLLFCRSLALPLKILIWSVAVVDGACRSGFLCGDGGVDFLTGN